jgi:hypothetical protein
MFLLQMLPGLMATVVLSPALAVVPTVAAGTPDPLPEKSAHAMCAAPQPAFVPACRRAPSMI